MKRDGRDEEGTDGLVEWMDLLEKGRSGWVGERTDWLVKGPWVGEGKDGLEKRWMCWRRAGWVEEGTDGLKKGRMG